jgi:predicted small lipoprotein YifL
VYSYLDKPMNRVGRTILLIALLTAPLAGCGVRGSLDLPPEAKAAQSQTAQAESGQGKPEGAAPKPHKGFILDGLIR